MRDVIARLVLLLAVLLMPLGMSPAAAATGDHHMAMEMAMGHCDQQAPEHRPKAGFAECTMACAAALPAIPSADDEPLRATAAEPPAIAAVVLHGLTPETATPPPRRS